MKQKCVIIQIELFLNANRHSYYKAFIYYLYESELEYDLDLRLFLISEVGLILELDEGSSLGASSHILKR